MSIRIRSILNSPFLIFLIVGIFVHLDLLIMGNYAIAKDHDFWDSFWPIQTAMAERLKLGKFPLWLAGYESGSPFSFWDINWVSIPVFFTMISKGHFGYFLVMLTQFVIASGGMYLFLKKFYPERDYFELVLSGLMYAISIIGLTYWRVPDLAALPLCIYSFYEFVDFFNGNKKSWPNAVFSYVVVALNIYLLKGVPALALFLLSFFIFYKRKQVLKKLIIFFFFFGFIVLLNAPTLAVNVTYLGTGMRQFLVHPLVETVSVSVYLKRLSAFLTTTPTIVVMTLGTIATFVFFTSFANIKRWSPLSKILFLYFITSNFIFYFLDGIKWFEEIRHNIPFASYHLNHLLLVNPFILFLLIVENIPFFFRHLNNFSLRVWTVICAITVILMFWHLKHGFPATIYEILISAFGLIGVLLTCFYLKKRNANHTVGVASFFISLIFVERLLHLYSLKIGLVNPPSFEHFAASPSYEILAKEPHKYNFRMSYINWHPSIGLYNQFQVAGGCANDYSLSYAKYWNQIVKEDPKYFAYPYKAYLDDPTTLFESPTPNVHNKLNFNFDLLAFNNVKYILARYEIKLPEQYGLKLLSAGLPPVRQSGLRRLSQALERIAEAPVYFVYQVENYAPRFFVNKSAQFFPDEESLIAHMKLADRKILPLKTLLIEEHIPQNLKKELLPLTKVDDQSFENIEPTSYDDDKIEFSINVKAPSFLIVNDNYSPNWFARINGEAVPVLTADLTLKAIPLLKTGPAKIEVYYAPKWVLLSYYISTAIFTLLIMLVLSACYSIYHLKIRNDQST